MITRHAINEQTARIANDINSFRTYQEGTATAGYEAYIKELETVLEAIKEKKPALYDKAVYKAERFSKKYADYLNAYYRNEAACPSIMICGAGNFPVRKKERQNSRRDTLMQEYNYLMEYKEDIKRLLTVEQPIMAGDADAIERLKDKIADLEKQKQEMIEINALFRKHRTRESLAECEGEISDDMQRHIDFLFNHYPQLIERTGHIFDTAGTNAELKRLNARLSELEAAKEAGNPETEYDGFTVIENSDIMRLQIIFPGKPDDETRDILKHEGFKWAPSQNAWQRQLTDNARSALRRVIKQLA